MVVYTLFVDVQESHHDQEHLKMLTRAKIITCTWLFLKNIEFYKIDQETNMPINHNLLVFTLQRKLIICLNIKTKQYFVFHKDTKQN